jgi:hypothetical protein
MQVHRVSWAPFSAWPCIFCLPATATTDTSSMSTRNQGTHGTMRHKQMPCHDVCNVPVPPPPLPPPAQHTLVPSAMAVDSTTCHKQMSRCNMCNVPVPLPPPLPPAQHALAPSAMTVDSLPPAPPTTALEGMTTTDMEVKTALCNSVAVELTYQ